MMNKNSNELNWKNIKASLVLENKEWRTFKLVEIFSVIKRGKRLKKGDHILGVTPYVSSTALNNGIDTYIGNKENTRIFKNCLTLANSGSIGSTYYHPYKFIASDHVTKLENSKFKRCTYLFISILINRLGEKYSFNREVNDKRLKKEIILLPVNSKNKPDHEYMESYIKDLQSQKEQEYLEYISKRIEYLKDIQKPVALEVQEWRSVYLSDLLSFEKGDQNNMSSLRTGDMPLVSAKKNDNAYKGFVAYNDKKIYFKNTLTLNNDGDGGAGLAFYQPNNYLLDNHVTALYPKSTLNKFVLLFLSMCITLQKNKFGHGYAINNKRLKVFQIMLPINSQGQPDYEYMEQYMKYLEYQKLSAYLEFKKKV